MLVVGAAFIAPAWMNTPKKLPAAALSTPAILYLERSLILLVVLLLAFTLLVRGVVRGQLPTSISKEGIEWAADVADKTEEAIAGLQEQIDNLEAELRLVEETFRPPSPPS